MCGAGFATEERLGAAGGVGVEVWLLLGEAAAFEDGLYALVDEGRGGIAALSAPGDAGRSPWRRAV